MGARIEGIGSNMLTIHGVDRTGGASSRSARINLEVGSFIVLAA